MKFFISLIPFVVIFVPVKYGLWALWQYIAERKSVDILLLILKSNQKLYFSQDSENRNPLVV